MSPAKVGDAKILQLLWEPSTRRAILSCCAHAFAKPYLGSLQSAPSCHAFSLRSHLFFSSKAGSWTACTGLWRASPLQLQQVSPAVISRPSTCSPIEADAYLLH